MVKGAGDTEKGENPDVTSKFHRDRGMPRKPGKAGHPGEVAKPTGSKHRGFSESGHMLPREVHQEYGDRHEEHEK